MKNLKCINYHTTYSFSLNRQVFQNSGPEQQSETQAKAEVHLTISELLEQLERTNDDLVAQKNNLVKEISKRIAEGGTDYSTNLLRKLAERKEETIKGAVAANQNTPIDVLVKLATLDNKYVNRGLAYNPKTPQNIISSILNKKDFYIDQNLVRNTEISGINLNELAARYSGSEGKWDKGIVYMIAWHKNTLPETLQLLAKDARIDFETVQAIWSNPNTPQKVKDEMKKRMAEKAA